MVIHGSERMYVEDKSVNNHPKQTVNHHGLDKCFAPTGDFNVSDLIAKAGCCDASLLLGT